MKKTIIFLGLLLFPLFSIGWSGGDNPKATKNLDDRVNELLVKMTLEEKVGQMTQVTLQSVSKTIGTRSAKHEIDFVKLDSAIFTYHVGSILNVYDVAHSLDYWHEVITEIQNRALKSKNKIPVLYGIDAIHGATYTVGATLFPQALNMASTWNRDLMKSVGEITSLEVKASGISWNFYPVMDIGRQPLWPRLWETLGEDVYLASEIGKQYIVGAQGNDFGAKTKLATCLKHYVGYSFPINGKDRTPAWISERMLREYFLPTFQAGIDAGSPTVMVNSAEVDGIPVHSDYHLLTEVLRGEMKFQGFVVSDWEDIIRLYTRDKVAATPKEAVRMAVMAGVDMSMVPYDFSFYNYLMELVKEGTIPMTRIDEAVSRILKVKFQAGIFENPYPDKSLKESFATKASTETNLNASSESIILVKNDKNMLPLSKNNKVLVAGPTADMLSVLNGGWTITWQGNEETLYPKNKNTVLKAIKAKIGSENVVYSKGSDFDKELNIAETVKLAAGVDAVVLCLGENTYCETPGNIGDLKLDECQLKLAQALQATGKPVILVMLGGRPRVITNIVDKSKAILLGFLPGMEGGTAIADLLFGDANPSGRLSVTYPRNPAGYQPYDYKNIEDAQDTKPNPLWNFGFGLSYTTYEYSGLKLSSKSISKDGSLKVSVTVKNTGKVAGKETVQLYLSDLVASVSRPVKQLKGFDKVLLQPGESKVVEFTITPDMLSFIGRDMKRIVEPGDFKVAISTLTDNFKYE